MNDEEQLRQERGRLQECWRGRPASYHYQEIRQGLLRRLDGHPVLRQRNRARIRFHIRLLKARGLSAMRMPVRF